MDWLPRRREKMIAMVEVWLDYITPARAAAWGIPVMSLEELGYLKIKTKNLFDIVDGPESTGIAVTACKAAVKALKAKMRDLKRRYFLKPPLTDTDIVALSLSVPASTPTVIGVPKIHVHLIATPKDSREVEVARTVKETGSRATPYGMESL